VFAPMKMDPALSKTSARPSGRHQVPHATEGAVGSLPSDRPYGRAGRKMADSQTALVKRPHAFPFKTLDFSHFLVFPGILPVGAGYQSCRTCRTSGTALVGQVGRCSCRTTTPLGVWGGARQKSGTEVRCGKVSLPSWRKGPPSWSPLRPIGPQQFLETHGIWLKALAEQCRR
jgi:hypothetical protein